MSGLFLIRWTDAVMDVDAPTPCPREEYTCTTVGFLVGENATFVALAQEETPDGFRAVTQIPRCCISHRIELTEEL